MFGRKREFFAFFFVFACVFCASAEPVRISLTTDVKGTLPIANLPVGGANGIAGLDSSGRLQAYDGTQLTGIPYPADSWSHTWAPADGDPTSVGWTVYGTAGNPTIASASPDSVPAYSLTPHSGTGSSGIKKTFGSGATGSWEVRVLAWIPTANTSQWAWSYTSAANGSNELYVINPQGTTKPVALGSTDLAAPVADLCDRWVIWTLRVYYSKDTAQSWALWAGSVLMARGKSSVASAGVTAGEFTFGKLGASASVAPGYIGGVWIKDTGINEAPPEYTYRASTFAQ